MTRRRNLRDFFTRRRQPRNPDHRPGTNLTYLAACNRIWQATQAREGDKQ